MTAGFSGFHVGYSSIRLVSMALTRRTLLGIVALWARKPKVVSAPLPTVPLSTYRIDWPKKAPIPYKTGTMGEVMSFRKNA